MIDFTQEEYASLATAEDFELVALSRNGIKIKDFLAIADESGFSLEDWAKWLRIGQFDQLLKKEGSDEMPPFQAERLLELARLFHHGNEVFGNPEKFKKWLWSEIMALGGVKPISLLDNTFGINMVHTELGRIEHGIFA
jgi:putative toxin-antitoxin system antitoxin component (TIGR02293 family)